MPSAIVNSSGRNPELTVKKALQNLCTPNSAPRCGYIGGPDTIRALARSGKLGEVPRLPDGTFVLTPDHIARANKLYKGRRK